MVKKIARGHWTSASQSQIMCGNFVIAPDTGAGKTTKFVLMLSLQEPTTAVVPSVEQVNSMCQYMSTTYPDLKITGRSSEGVSHWLNGVRTWGTHDDEPADLEYVAAGTFAAWLTGGGKLK